MLTAAFVRMYVQELGKQNPGLLQVINSNQEEFLRMINEPAPEGEEGDVAARLAQELGGTVRFTSSSIDLGCTLGTLFDLVLSHGRHSLTDFCMT